MQIKDKCHHRNIRAPRVLFNRAHWTYVELCGKFQVNGHGLSRTEFLLLNTANGQFE